jgi:hypothetical protein
VLYGEEEKIDPQVQANTTTQFVVVVLTFPDYFPNSFFLSIEREFAYRDAENHRAEIICKSCILRTGSDAQFSGGRVGGGEDPKSCQKGLRHMTLWEHKKTTAVLNSMKRIDREDHKNLPNINSIPIRLAFQNFRGLQHVYAYFHKEDHWSWMECV